MEKDLNRVANMQGELLSLAEEFDLPMPEPKSISEEDRMLNKITLRQYDAIKPWKPSVDPEEAISKWSPEKRAEFNRKAQELIDRAENLLKQNEKESNSEE